MQGIFPELFGCVVAKKAIASVSSNFGLSFLSAKKEEFMHRSFTVLSIRADASTFSKKVRTQLKPLSTFRSESLFELFFSYNRLLLLRMLSARKIDGICRTLTSMPVMSLLTGAASMNEFRSTRQQRAYFRTMWKKAVSACITKRGALLDV